VSDHWKQKCPEGHVSLRQNTDDPRGSWSDHEWYCPMCETGYTDEDVSLVDRV
jgi:hypothetical protein